MSKQSFTGKRRFSKRGRILLGTVILLLVLFVSFFLSAALAPAHSFLYRITSPVTSAFRRAGDFIKSKEILLENEASIQEERERLTMRIEELERENQILQSRAKRSLELEELYELDLYYKEYDKIGAQIIGLQPNNWINTYLIDQGSEDGIELYMPVLCGAGLAGYVSSVYDTYSVVTSLVDQSSRIYGKVNRTGGDLVVVEGASGFYSTDTGPVTSDICLVRFVTGEIDISVGDEIVTSSLGDIYPPGIVVGSVAKITPIGDGYEAYAFIEPRGDLSKTELVLIITEKWKGDIRLTDLEADDS